MSLEDLLGGRVLGWIGAVAVLVGLIFLLVLAASRGWIGEEARVLMAAGTSLLLAVAGFRLHERRGRTEAALAATAPGVAGLFATIVVAGPVYGLIGDLPATALVTAMGAAATALAIRWDVRGMGWLGLLGALLSPALVGAGGEGAGVALMLTAYVATCAIGLWRDWPLLAGTAFAIAVAQVMEWIADGEPAAATAVLVLAILGAATVISAAAFDWRARTVSLRVWSQVLVALNAVVLANLGTAGLWELGETAVTLWLAALAVAHVSIGVAARLEWRVTPELGLTLVALGVLLGDVAFATLADGPARRGLGGRCRRLRRRQPPRPPRRRRGRRADRPRRTGAARARHGDHGRRARGCDHRRGWTRPRSPRWPRSASAPGRPRGWCRRATRRSGSCSTRSHSPCSPAARRSRSTARRSRSRSWRRRSSSPGGRGTATRCRCPRRSRSWAPHSPRRCTS